MRAARPSLLQTSHSRIRLVAIFVFSFLLVMWLRDSFLLFSAVSPVVLGAPTTPHAADEEQRQDISADFTYDAIIVGGGPSGLAALSALGRVRRNALLIDSGQYRNADTRDMHDVLGFDGVAPAYYRYTARTQISFYNTTTMTNGTVTRITPTGQSLFTVEANIRSRGKMTLRARKVILGTGLQDILPDTPGVREAWGKGIYWCPWCDGHEYADQPFGLLGPLEKIPGMVREVLTLNKNIIAFINGTDNSTARAETEAKEPGWATYLKLNGIQIDNRAITRIVRLSRDEEFPEIQRQETMFPSVAHRDRFRVEFTEGQPVERSAFMGGFPTAQRSSLGEDTGVTMIDDRMTADSQRGMMTNIDGVFAVGDANTDGSTNVPHALYTGKRCAVFMHIELAEEEEKVQVLKAEQGVGWVKRDAPLEIRDVWDTMNGQPGEPLYAGEFQG